MPLPKNKQAAYQREWRKKNLEKSREIQRRYRRNNPEACRAAKKKYYRKNRERHRADTLKWQKAHPNYTTQRRKRVAGRVCGSCGTDDSKKSWSANNGYCVRCYARSLDNGFCRKCGAAKYKDGCRECVSRPQQRGANQVRAGILTMWDAFWCSPIQGEVSWKTLSETFRLKKDSAQTKLERMVDSLTHHAIPFEKKYSDEDGSLTLVVDMEALQKLVDKVVGVA